MRWVVHAVLLAIPAAVNAGVISFEGDVFPEDFGFTRAGTFDAERWLDDGWFFHHVELGEWAPPPMGEQDFYNHALSAFVQSAFFIEWRMMSDAPNSEVFWQNGASLMVLVGGPVRYHFNVGSGLARIVRGVQYPVLYFDIEPGIPHTYRLEVYAGDYFEFTIDGAVMDSGLPEDAFPTPDALMSFGSQFYMDESTSQWDYVRFGTIPEPATGMCVLLGAVALVARRRSR